MHVLEIIVHCPYRLAYDRKSVKSCFRLVYIGKEPFFGQAVNATSNCDCLLKDVVYPLGVFVHVFLLHTATMSFRAL